MAELHSLLGAQNSASSSKKNFLDKLKPLWVSSGTTRPLSIGYGADTTSNGVTVEATMTGFEVFRSRRIAR